MPTYTNPFDTSSTPSPSNAQGDELRQILFAFGGVALVFEGMFCIYHGLTHIDSPPFDMIATFYRGLFAPFYWLWAWPVTGYPNLDFLVHIVASCVLVALYVLCGRELTKVILYRVFTRSRLARNLAEDGSTGFVSRHFLTLLLIFGPFTIFVLASLWKHQIYPLGSDFWNWLWKK